MGIDFNDSILMMSSRFLIAIFLVSGAYVVYQDVTTRKIPNALLMRSLFAAAAVFAVIIGAAIIYNDPHPIRYARLIAMNFGIALVAGYGFYHFDLWSPGDGKYFPLVALLVPLQCYSKQYVPWFPSIIILVNAYLIAFLVLFAQALYVIAKNVHKSARAGFFSPSNLPKLAGAALAKMKDYRAVLRAVSFVFYIVSTLLIIQVVYALTRDFIPFSSKEITFLSVVLVYIVGMNIQKVLRLHVLYLIAAYALLAGTILFHYYVLQENLLLNIVKALGLSFFTMGFLPVARIMVIVYGNATEIILAEDLKPGMALSADSVRWLAAEKKLEIPCGVPLEPVQCQSIRDNVPNMQRMEKATHITFGPYIFLGALFVVVFGRSVMHYLVRS